MHTPVHTPICTPDFSNANILAKKGDNAMKLSRYYPCSKENNAKCDTYITNLPFQWISYEDANNPYGWDMMECLSTGRC